MIAQIQLLVPALLLLIGAAFTLTASVGLLRLPDLYTRIHAASKAGTLGSCVVLVALAIHSNDIAISLRAMAGVAFFMMTVPISSHLLARAAYATGPDLWSGTTHDAMRTGVRNAGTEVPSDD